MLKRLKTKSRSLHWTRDQLRTTAPKDNSFKAHFKIPGSSLNSLSSLRSPSFKEIFFAFTVFPKELVVVCFDHHLRVLEDSRLHQTYVKPTSQRPLKFSLTFGVINLTVKHSKLQAGLVVDDVQNWHQDTRCQPSDRIARCRAIQAQESVGRQGSIRSTRG